MIALNDLAVSNELDSQAMETISGAKCYYRRPVCIRPRRRFCAYLKGYRFPCFKQYRKCWQPRRRCWDQLVRA